MELFWISRPTKHFSDRMSLRHYKTQFHQPSLSYIRVRLAEVQDDNNIKCQRDVVVTDDDCEQERRHRYSDDQVIDLGSIIFGFYCRTRKMHNRGGWRVRFANE